jgi:aspartate dehydrogenase
MEQGKTVKQYLNHSLSLHIYYLITYYITSCIKFTIFAYMKKLVIVGCGRLAEIVANAVLDGLLPEYNLIGVYSRTASKAECFVSKLQQEGKSCAACTSLEDLLALKPDYLVEAASPAAMKELALPALRNGTSIITLSVGAFADTAFYQEVKDVAKANGTRVYIASGATGGFDVLRTATLMGNANVCFFNEKGVNALRRSVVYDPALETEKRIVFSGTAREAIDIFPTGLNVSVAASLASVGPENIQVTMQSTPDFRGDTQRVEIKNDQVHAIIDVYSATPEIAGWSVVSTLINIVSPIVF